MKKPEKKQIGLIALVIIAAIVIGSLVLRTIPGKKDYTISTTLPIYAITEKTEQDGIYCLTVQLEDWTVEEYSLSSNLLTMQTTESVYAEADPDDNYIGISLTVTIPGTEPKMDIGSVLKGGHTDYCEITALSAGSQDTVTESTDSADETSAPESNESNSAEASETSGTTSESVETTDNSTSEPSEEIVNQDWCFMHNLLYHSYSVPLVNYVGTDTYYEWQEQNTEPCSGNIVSFVEHFNISKDKFMELYEIDMAGLDDAFFESLDMTQEEYFGAYVFSQEQIDAIYSGDEKQIENAFAGNLSVTADDGNRYSLLWLEKHTAADYQQAGISAESIDALIDKVNTNSDYAKYRAEMPALSEQADQLAELQE